MAVLTDDATLRGIMDRRRSGHCGGGDHLREGCDMAVRLERGLAMK